MKISAVIVIHNNPKHLKKSLLSIVDEVDEIIIGDVGMTAKLPDSIVKKVVKIVKLDPATPFADLVKEGLKKHATGDYILYLDPDEMIPGSLWKKLKEKIPKYDYFLIPRKNIIFGKWISHTRWWPDYQLRFFKKDKIVWPAVLHPIPQGQGRELKLDSTEELAIEHYNYDSVSEFMEKLNRYARFEAEYLIKEKKTYSFTQATTKALSEFISRYFAHEGYKDGMHGAALSLLQMFYYLVVYFYYWEAQGYKLPDTENPTKTIHTFFRKALYETQYWMVAKHIVPRLYKLKLKLENRFIGRPRG